MGQRRRAGCQAAIDRKACAGDRRSQRRGEEANGFSDIFRAHDAAKRIMRSRFLEHVGVLRGTHLPGLRAHSARRDRIGANAEAAIFHRNQPREMDHAGLGRRVGRVAINRHPVHRHDVDDRALGRLELIGNRLKDVKRGVEIERTVSLPIGHAG